MDDKPLVNLLTSNPGVALSDLREGVGGITQEDSAKRRCRALQV